MTPDDLTRWERELRYHREELDGPTAVEWYNEIIPQLIAEVRRLQQQNEELVGDYEAAAVVLKNMVRHCGLEVGPACLEWDVPIGSLGLILAENYLKLRDKP